MGLPIARLQVEHVSVDALLLEPAHARLHPVRGLAAIPASEARFGQLKPIVVGEDDVVVAGHGTLLAARILGRESIAVVQALELEPRSVGVVLERMTRMGEEGSRDGAAV